MERPVELWLIRHGETEWSLSGAHTSRTDIPLTDRGRERARELAAYLKHRPFAAVFCSPMQRARETCAIAGYGEQAVIDDNLREWDYGIYEGKTTKAIRQEHPDWSVWKDPILDGETAEQVGERADAVISRAEAAAHAPDAPEARVALFAHAHILRILAARWITLGARAGQFFGLETGSLSVLGSERETHVITRWNRSFED